LGLADRFATICGQDTFGIQKPDPEILRRTIRAAGGTVETAVMIGDSVTDIRTARAAGIPVIVVDFGITSGQLQSLVRTGLSVTSPSCRCRWPQFRQDSDASTELWLNVVRFNGVQYVAPAWVRPYPWRRASGPRSLEGDG
jgi:hypothetical protein